jgi:hypothetical protein
LRQTKKLSIEKRHGSHVIKCLALNADEVRQIS